ncbi:hypothetical protein [Desulfurococcus amylolyticus]|uniref:Thioredoxin domain-containing protein n=1 Tax=Desulfurococcus amylolyticus DSM 16532 TaxID=768672 RepID=I3XQL7_DESAM|nr:hypothetical protein [Desulfurococcus amylolyticus]AFL66241.1 hypothetical protein Desfe_0331 [Desulfurococcus amylolyticus DSM 16532]
MSDDREILELLKKLLSKPERKIEGRVGLEVESIGPESPHGVYVFDHSSGKWILRQIEGDYFKPWEDGLYVIYFDNAKCPACRGYDAYWYPFVKLFGSAFKNSHYVVILCDWFTRECDSSIARGSFEHYDIHASPTTLLLYVENNGVKASKRLEGSKRIDELVNEVSNFIKSVKGSQVSGSG